MTEADWNSGADPQRMLESLRGRGSGRKLSLSAVGCCRRSRLLMQDSRSRWAIEWTECLIEGLEGANDAPSEEEHFMAAAAHCMATAMWAGDGTDGDIEATLQYARWVMESLSEGSQEKGDILQDHVALLRCIFDNPFRRANVESAWLTSRINALAKAIYDERSFDRMPILADALEDAGCANQDMLTHCRGQGPHARGCWVVDLLLGRQ
jgi:hypothetical protein